MPPRQGSRGPLQIPWHRTLPGAPFTPALHPASKLVHLDRKCRMGALPHNGEEAIDTLADPRIRVQRCMDHGPRGLRFASSGVVGKPSEYPSRTGLEDV